MIGPVLPGRKLWTIQRKKRPADPSKINMYEDNEVKCWTKALGASKEELQRAVEKVGNSAAAVQIPQLDIL